MSLLLGGAALVVYPIPDDLTVVDVAGDLVDVVGWRVSLRHLPSCV